MYIPSCPFSGPSRGSTDILLAHSQSTSFSQWAWRSELSQVSSSYSSMRFLSASATSLFKRFTPSCFCISLIDSYCIFGVMLNSSSKSLYAALFIFSFLDVFCSSPSSPFVFQTPAPVLFSSLPQAPPQPSHPPEPRLHHPPESRSEHWTKYEERISLWSFFFQTIKKLLLKIDFVFFFRNNNTEEYLWFCLVYTVM